MNNLKQVELFLAYFFKDTSFRNHIFSVGGYVRDELLGISSKDLDIVVDVEGGAEVIVRTIHDIFHTQTSMPRQMGASYPIWQLTFKEDIHWSEDITFFTKDAIIEFSETMTESFPDINSRQRVVSFGTLMDDVKRRDFTCNALLKDIVTGEIIDLCGGITDLNLKVLRTHPDVIAEDIFSADPIRILRAFRFAIKYGFTIHPDTSVGISKAKERLSIVSIERIMDEIEKVCNLGKLAEFIEYLDLFEMLPLLFPELIPMKGCTQSKEHHAEGDVFQHTLLTLKNAKPGIVAQLFALLHDVGKPNVRFIEDGKIKFIGHDDVGSEIAVKVLERLKVSNEIKDTIVLFIFNHMRVHNLDKTSTKALRKLIREIDNLNGFLDCCESDCLGSLPVNNNIPEIREACNIILNSKATVSRKAVLNGHEIMETLKLTPGPKIGEITKILLDWEDSRVSEGQEISKEAAKSFILNDITY